MTKVDEILRRAQKELSEELGYSVKLSIASTKRKDFVMYARIWEVCFSFSIEEIKNNTERDASRIMIDIHRAYTVACKMIIEDIDVPTMMQVIGKDRTSYYSISKTAQARIDTKDEYFTYIFSSITQLLKEKGYDGFEI